MPTLSPLYVSGYGINASRQPTISQQQDCRQLPTYISSQPASRDISSQPTADDHTPHISTFDSPHVNMGCLSIYIVPQSGICGNFSLFYKGEFRFKLLSTHWNALAYIFGFQWMDNSLTLDVDMPVVAGTLLGTMSWSYCCSYDCCNCSSPDLPVVNIVLR